MMMTITTMMMMTMMMMMMKVEWLANPSYGAVRLKLWPQWHNLRTTFGGFMMMILMMMIG